MYKTESEARSAALALSKQDGLGEDAYVPLYNKPSDSFVIYPKVETLAYKIAKTGSYAGKDCCIHMHDESGKLVSSQTTVFRLVMDQKQEFGGDEVYFDEYAKSEWIKKYPHIGMAKIAFAKALRQGWPDILANLVTFEEAKCELDFGQKVDRVVTMEHMVKEPVLIPVADNIQKMVDEIFPQGVKK